MASTIPPVLRSADDPTGKLLSTVLQGGLAAGLTVGGPQPGGSPGGIGAPRLSCRQSGSMSPAARRAWKPVSHAAKRPSPMAARIPAISSW